MTRVEAATVKVGDTLFSHHGWCTVLEIRIGTAGGYQFRLEYVSGWMKARYCTRREMR